MSTDPTNNPDERPPTEQAPIHYGPYELLELLGEGAMARVYLAKQSGPMGFTKKVALKRLRKGALGRDRREIEALVNEARLGGKLRHPNLVEIYGCDVVEGSFCLAMEYVEGWELDEVLWLLACADVPMPQAAVVDILCQVADGIAYAHAATDENGSSLRLVHRDLKPQNIFLDTRGTVKIADFGLAKSTANLYQTTEADVTRGSPLYMSPEQIEGLPLDGRSDLFAVGSIAAELATSIRPFEGNSIPNTLVKILNVDHGDTLAVLDGTFPELMPIVAKLFARKPEDRYADGYALLTDLHALGDGQAVGVHTRGLARALSGNDLTGLPASLVELYTPIATALCSAQTFEAGRLAAPASPGPPSEPAPAPAIQPPPAHPTAAPGPGAARQASPVPPSPPGRAQPAPPPRAPVPAPRMAVRDLDQLIYEDTVRPDDSRAGRVERPRTLRSARQAALRSILITIFALAVSIYFTALYFEIIAPPSVVLSNAKTYETLPSSPEPLRDPTGQLIHVPRGIARADGPVDLSTRTVVGSWDVLCVHRPLGGSLWTRTPMTSYPDGRHQVTLPEEALREGVAEYYFEATKLSTGLRVQSGAPDAPYRVQVR